MGRKSESVLEYIRSLPPGTAISIRSLAGAMDVSEGTSYKAIKAAEAEGLVVTREKIGTVRVDGSSRGISAEQLAARLGLKCLAGDLHLRRNVYRIVPVLGGAEGLQAIQDASPDPVLAVCGGREDIMEAAVSAGAHLLLTDGAVPSPELLAKATAGGLCVLSSPLSGALLLPQLYSALSGRLPERELQPAADWMSAPRYIFKNDYISDFYRLNRSDFEGVFCQPVVDDEFRLCGYLSPEKVFPALASDRISQVLTGGEPPCVVTEDDAMQEIMEKMLEANSNYACVLKDGALTGVISPADIIRLCLYRTGSTGETQALEKGGLSRIDSGADSRQMVFQTRFPKSAGRSDLTENWLMPCMLHAAKKHFSALFGTEAGSIQAGSFYTAGDRFPDEEVLINSTVRKAEKGVCVIETEVYDDEVRYAAGNFVICSADVI